MTFNPTPEQIEAAAEAIRKVECRAALISDVDMPTYKARAALVAAQGAAPQAVGERGDLYTCVDLGHEDCDGSHRDHRAPVLPSSTLAETKHLMSSEANAAHLREGIQELTEKPSIVDEDALWRVVREAKIGWLRRCGQPGHTEDIDVWITRAVAEWLKGQGR